MDGFGLIDALRSDGRHRDRPILVLSTESSEEQKARARAAGATGWIGKPFAPAKLSADVRQTGRASGRARVCRYVQIPVGAGSLKKTNIDCKPKQATIPPT